MKLRMSEAFKALVLTLFLAVPAFALVCDQPTVPNRLTGGHVPTAIEWNAAIVDAYTYINTHIVEVLNIITAKGDFYIYDGSALRAQSVGTNDDVLIADDGQASGVRWGVTAGLKPVAIKGDIEAHDGSTIQRVPVGTDGYALMVTNSAASGVAWTSLANDAVFPKGAIIAWSPTFAGTGTPAGYLVCDGTSGTPNLIGRFVLGTRPNGSSASPSAGGFGAKTVDTTSGTSGHTHTFSITGNPNNTTSPEVGTVGVATGTGATVAAGGHTCTIVNQAAPGSGTNQPADYAVVYLMKQ
jgi:hypothetical protein